MQYQFFKTMQQKQIVSRSQPNWEPGQTDRKNIQGSLHRYIDYQLPEQQALSIQSKLPKGFFLINLNNGDLEKVREQVRINFVKIETSRNQTTQMEDKKSQKKIQVKQKQKSNNLSKKSKISQIPKIMDAQFSQKNRKQTALKKKTSMKNNDIKLSQSDMQDGDSMQQQFLIEQNKQIKKGQNNGGQKNRKKQQQPKQKQKKVKETFKQLPLKQKQHQRQNEQQIRNNNPITANEPIGNLDDQLCSYISLLPLGNPRYNPQTSQMLPQGSLQTNTLRYLFGLRHGYPIQVSVPKLSQKQKNFCNNMLQRLSKHKSAQGFKVPVDPISQGVPDYHHIIYNPMDLQTIEKKLKKDKYKEISQFHMDVNLIFLNSYKYNRRETFYFNAAVEFEDYYNQLLKEAERNPEEYSKQYIPKLKGKPENSGQLDYTQITPLKKKKKAQLRSSVVLARSQVLQKQNKAKQAKGKNAYDDTGGLFSHSMVAEANHDFNMDIQHPFSNQIKQSKKAAMDEKKEMKLKKIKSMWIDSQIISQSGQIQNTSQLNSMNPLPSLGNNNTNSNDDEDYDEFNIKANQKYTKNKKKPKTKAKEKQNDKKFTKTLADQIKQSQLQQQLAQKEKNINNAINPATNDQSYPQNIPSFQTNEQQQQNINVQSSKIVQTQRKIVQTKQKQENKQIKSEFKGKSIQKYKVNAVRRKDDYNDDDDDQMGEQNQRPMQIQEQQYNEEMDISGMSVNNERYGIGMGSEDGFQSGKSIDMNQAQDEMNLLFQNSNQEIKPKEESAKKQQPKEKTVQIAKPKVQQQAKAKVEVKKPQLKYHEMQIQKPIIAQQQKPVKNDIIINNLVQGQKRKHHHAKKNSAQHHQHHHVNSNEQSITVNNINTHPPNPHVMNFQIMVQNLQHHSSTPHITTSSAASSHQKTKNISKANQKSKKLKTRDEEYREQSDDQEYVTNPNKASKKQKDRTHKPRPKKKDQDVSYSEQNRNGNPKKRGRHAKKATSKNSDYSGRTPGVNQSANFELQSNHPNFLSSNPPTPPQSQLQNPQTLNINNPATVSTINTPNFASNPSQPPNPSPYHSANAQQLLPVPQQNKKQVLNNSSIFLENGQSQMIAEQGINFQQLLGP